LTDDSLQSADKDQQESRAVAEKLHDAVIKGGAENAGRENDGREIDGPMCTA